MERKVTNKVVVVTGGAGGIGMEMARKFLKNDAKAAIILDIDEQNGAEAVNQMTEEYGTNKAEFIKCDVTTDLKAVFEKIIEQYKTIDVFINNAAVLNEKSVIKTMSVNAVAVMEWSLKFYDYARKDKGGNGGTIINLSSIWGYRNFPFYPSYQASKYAVIGFSKSLGHEYNYKKTAVRVVVLCPGGTHTKLTVDIHARDDESLADLLEETKNHEWQEVDAIGRGVMEIFEKAESGTVWLVEGSRPAVMI